MTTPNLPKQPPEATDIPPDIWEAGATEAMMFVQWLRAGNSTGELSEHAIAGLADSFARAIMAERKRCADAARRHAENWERAPEGIVPRNAIDAAVRSAFSIVTLIEAGVR